jgi:hypothetical protein
MSFRLHLGNAFVLVDQMTSFLMLSSVVKLKLMPSVQRCEHPVCCLDKTPDNQVFAAGDEQGGLHVFKLWNLHQKADFDRAASS